MEANIAKFTAVEIIIWIIMLVIWIAINYIVSKNFEKVAVMKGHTNVSAFGMCFGLGLIGLGFIGYFYVHTLPIIGNTHNLVNRKISADKQYEYDKYECKSVTVTNQTVSGKCMLCKEYSDIIRYCSIDKGTYDTKIPVCDSCIEKLKNNAKE